MEIQVENEIDLDIVDEQIECTQTVKADGQTVSTDTKQFSLDAAEADITAWFKQPNTKIDQLRIAETTVSKIRAKLQTLNPSNL